MYLLLAFAYQLHDTFLLAYLSLLLVAYQCLLAIPIQLLFSYDILAILIQVLANSMQD